jgi:hypothetical protein
MVLHTSQQLNYDPYWGASVINFETPIHHHKICHFGNYPEFTQIKSANWNVFASTSLSFNGKGVEIGYLINTL